MSITCLERSPKNSPFYAVLLIELVKERNKYLQHNTENYNLINDSSIKFRPIRNILTGQESETLLPMENL